jgi:hypothetical protein
MIHYWYQALSSPLGIELLCSDPEGTRKQLYTARRDAKDLDLNQISICLSPFDPHKLWLVKRASKEPVHVP